MRKILFWLTLICVLCASVVTVGAATAAKSVSSFATVSNDGTAQITLTANIHLDQVDENLYFTLPGDASNVTVNGARAKTHMENGMRRVDLSGVIGKAVGDFTLNFTYNLPNLVSTNELDQLELQLPLLSGFAYPVQALEISVTLPGPVTAKPAFSSGYHQANIEKDLYCTTSGATIQAVSQVELKDHETLSMSLLVTEDMFPQKRLVAPDLDFVTTLTWVFTLAALAYWLIFLRNLPTWPTARSTPPEGYTAGELGSVLCLQGGDLNMMVFSWAELGYLLIHLQPGGKVRLSRQMDMGNERSAFEQRCFKLLFGRRDTVDAGSIRYAELYLRVKTMQPNLSSLMDPKSGSIQLFRGLAVISGVLGGATVAIGISAGAALQWFLVILLGGLALVSCWKIQTWAVNLLVPDRRSLWISLAFCGMWLLLGAVSGQFNPALGMVIGQLLIGVLVFLGGKRNLAGKQAMAQTLGLRRYLKTLSREDIQAIHQNNPEYFHRMMPYAMTLGVDYAFAKRFGKFPVGQCPYISIGTDSTMRASQWRGLMRRTLKGMRTQVPNTKLEKLIQLLQSFVK